MLAIQLSQIYELNFVQPPVICLLISYEGSFGSLYLLPLRLLDGVVEEAGKVGPPHYE